MHALQYAATLPADYDMEIIRDRVRTRGHLLDAHEGLGIKAYGIRERGVDGSPVNQYAPFYLWADALAMNRFLLGDGFRGVIRDFGRPEVRHWMGVHHERGPSAGAVPGSFVRRTQALAEGTDPATAVEEAMTGQRRLARTDGVHTTALALDPRHWELVHFTLWEGTAPATEGDRFRVLHLSAPGAKLLPTGAQW
ncbi:hypothetical protein A6A06_28395 [Streptomyces sp. CB02923]|uniref:DUF4865 family protein n=1 Tax=Streptomyces sp. CB02923 TaxID=1718985 RepID=UPI00093E910E|nr:DUF4865 family protein [Streptomyces sp. CB02923]OKH98139.1 hypothetical protein A6A06_28395 [Streptomyces sp. CB02923]